MTQLLRNKELFENKAENTGFLETDMLQYFHPDGKADTVPAQGNHSHGVFRRRPMKKYVVWILAAMLCLCACTAKTETTKPEEPEIGSGMIAGGWTVFADETVAPLPEDAQKAFDKATEQLVGVGYTPVALIGQQVVAGMNYAILCKAETITAEPETTLKVLIIYADLEGNASITNIADFVIADYTNDTTEPAEMLAGGWYAPKEFQVPNLPAEAQKAFDKASDGFVGSGIFPLALLGTQVVAGTNYAFLCRVEPVVLDPIPSIEVVIVYEDLEGNASFTSFTTVNAADFNK